MIITENNQQGQWIRIQARSHFSLGITGLLTLIGTLSALTLVLAIVATWLGYWPVLAIAILQVVLLGVIFTRAWKSAWTVETISVSQGNIAVLQERFSSCNKTQLDAAWARVVLQQPRHRWYPPRLVIKSGNEMVVLGEFLNTAEKRKLAKVLSKAVGEFSAWQTNTIENEVTE